MVSGEQILVKAPNGAVYRFHPTRSANTGYVYALGHRVYGVIGWSALYGTGYISTFKPKGKWAFIVGKANADAEKVTAPVSF